MIGSIMRLVWVIWVTIVCLHYCSFTHIPHADAQEFLADGGTWFYVAPEPKKHPSFEYTVQSGDTLASIAAKHNMTWQQLWDINRDRISDPNVIHVGQKIRVKGAIIVTPPKRELTRTQKIDRLIMFMVSKSGLTEYKWQTKDQMKEAMENYVTVLKLEGWNRPHQTRKVCDRLRDISRMYEIHRLAEAIVDQAKDEEEFYKLVGLAWQESHFINRRGAHGEITFYQILPSTLKAYCKVDNIGLVVLCDQLLDSPENSTALALEMLRTNKWNWSWWNHDPGYITHLNNKIYWFKHWWIGGRRP